MKRFLLYILIPIGFNSCASFTQQEKVNVRVHNEKPFKIVYEEDTLTSKRNRIKISPSRSKEGFEIVVLKDSSSTKIRVESIFSLDFYPFLLNRMGGGLAMRDLGNKKYTFPKHIYLDTIGGSSQYFDYNPWAYREGEVDFHLSLPHFNSFNLNPLNEGQKSNSGFWGIQLGLDFYHKRNRYIGLYYGLVTDFFIPVPAPVSIFGSYENMTSQYMAIYKGYRFRNCKFGYGMGISENTWELKYYGDEQVITATKEERKNQYITVGAYLPLYYQLRPSFHLGLIYRPSFYRFTSNNKYVYEHVWSFDIAWKIPLKK